MDLHVITVFLVLALLELVRSTVEKNAQSVDWVVVVTVTMGYDDIFQNWLYWFKKLSLNMKLVVVAEDDSVLQKYQNQSLFTVISFDFPSVPDSEKESGLDYDTLEFNLLTSRRPKYLIQLLQEYENIIYTDIDTIWLKDPR